jgi:bifunctional oligoribonuclease and PAP phosphatase NrnA
MNDTQTRAIREIIAAIRNNHRFLIATHVRPDGDAAGALLGLQFILRRLGKHADACCQDPLPWGYDFLPGAEGIKNRPAAHAAYDVAILVDCGDFLRVGDELAELIGPTPFLINIDHHVINAPFGHIYWINPAASSTCEMLFDLCLHLSLAPDPDIATQLYTGILTDTGSFRYSNTNGRVLEIASVLVEAGADPAHIAHQVYDSAPVERIRLLSRVLSTAEFYAEGRLASAELTLDMIADVPGFYMDSEGFINHLRSVRSVQLALLFREGHEGLIHVSMRSKEGVDVAKLAQRYGGGGHKQAAACRLPGKLEEIRSRMISEALQYIPKN